MRSSRLRSSAGYQQASSDVIESTVGRVSSTGSVHTRDIYIAIMVDGRCGRVKCAGRRSTTVL